MHLSISKVNTTIFKILHFLPVTRYSLDGYRTDWYGYLVRYGTRTQKQNKITINRSTLYGSGMVMYRTGETKIFPFIFETCGTSNEYGTIHTFSWYYLKYGTSTDTVPLRRIILVRHNDKNKKTIKKVYPTRELR